MKLETGHVEAQENFPVSRISQTIELPGKPSPNLRVVRSGFDGSSRALSFDPNKPLRRRDRESSPDHLFDTPFGKLPFQHSHGMIAVYDRHTHEATLIGVVNPERGETTFNYNPGNHTVEVETWMDNVRMNENDVRPADLTIINKPITEALKEYQNIVSPNSDKENRPITIASLLWLARGKDVGAKDILAQIEMIDGLNLVWIDDGHSPIGDPLATNPYFFRDTEFRNLKEVIDTIHKKGVKVGFWVSPFEISPQSAILRNHPDYIVRNSFDIPYRLPGRPLANGPRDLLGGIRGLYLLDLANPSVNDYLYKMAFTLVSRLGVDSIKADFLNRAYDKVFIGNRENLTRAELYRKAMEHFIAGMNAAARSLGKTVELLLCQAPIFSSLHLNDGNFRMRYTDDTWPFPMFHAPVPAAAQYVLEKLHHKLMNSQGWFDRATETAFWRRFLGNRSEDDAIVFDSQYGVDMDLALSYVINSQLPKNHQTFTIGSDVRQMNSEARAKLQELIKTLTAQSP